MISILKGRGSDGSERREGHIKVRRQPTGEVAERSPGAARGAIPLFSVELLDPNDY